MMEQQNSSDLKIKSKCDLEGYINDEILKIKQLDAAGKNDESQKLANNVSYLSRKLNLGGMIIDPLTDTKYFVSLGQLKGGVISYADEWSEHDPKRLYDKELNVVREEIRKLSTLDRISGRSGNEIHVKMHSIVIQNRSRYTLEYSTFGTDKGFFFTGDGLPIASFRGPNKTIQPGYSAGFALIESRLSNFAECLTDISSGCRGFISFRIRTAKDIFVIVFGWHISGSGGRNKGGCEIRGRNYRDIESIGYVTDMGKFLLLKHHGGPGLYEINYVQETAFKVIYRFNDLDYAANYILEIDDDLNVEMTM